VPDEWTEDGIPSWIELTWTGWKGRPASQKKAPYLIRLYHNPKSLCFCPVHWVLTHWSMRDDLGNDGAAIFEKMSADTYQKNVVLLFNAAGFQGCSSHSVRRSAAQWAGRCGANVNTIKNIGRWLCLMHCQKYTAEGVQLHDLLMRDTRGGADPIFEFYPFNSRTAVSSIEATATELRAMQATL
jgi:hypothetical protein